jgi:hypothetical protein
MTFLGHKVPKICLDLDLAKRYKSTSRGILNTVPTAQYGAVSAESFRKCTAGYSILIARSCCCYRLLYLPAISINPTQNSLIFEALYKPLSFV